MPHRRVNQTRLKDGGQAVTDQYAEIDGAISFIHRHLDEPLSLPHLARHVAYSPYHFVRLFKERMGLTPMHYVAALRLQRAKELLLHTNLSIRDIGLEIGQQSLGTFTTRFTQRVGMTPALFRHAPLEANDHLRALQRLNDWRAPGLPAHQGATIAGTVQATLPFAGVILLGLFARPIPEGRPLYGTLLGSPGEFRLTGVRPGTYYIMATSVAWQMQAVDVLLPYTTLRTRSREPLIVRPDAPVPHQQVMLYPPRLDDPPILISLPLLMQRFLSRVRQDRNR